MAKKDKKDSSSSELVRRFRQNPALFIGTFAVLILVVVSFVLVPALVPESSRGGDLTFGYYDKAPISWVPGNMFSQYQAQAVDYYQNQGQDINNFRTSSEIWRQAFDATVVHTAILQILKRSNYSVPKKTVDRNVAQLPMFQENGRFSAVLYKQMSDTRRMDIRRQVHDDIAKRQYYNDTFYGLLIPSAEADFISRMSGVTRNFEMVSFNVDDYPEEEYLAYGEENANLFRSIHLSVITIGSSEREAKKILDSIKDGASTFEDAARARSQDSYADRGGDMGNKYSYELEAEIHPIEDRERVFNLRRGDYSDVIKIGDNWAFFRVEEEITAADFSDPLVMERVRAYIRNYDRGRMEDYAITIAREFISEAIEDGFDNASRWRNLQKHNFGPIPINYGGVDLFAQLQSFTIPDLTPQNMSDLASNENFWKTAFSTETNTPSEPLVQGDKILVFYPVEQIDVEESTLENLAQMYSSYWQNYIAEQSIQFYFLNNERMDDRFWDTYFRIFMP